MWLISFGLELAFGFSKYMQEKEEDGKMSDDIFDFGFTAVNEDELKVAQDAARQADEYSTTINDTGR